MSKMTYQAALAAVAQGVINISESAERDPPGCMIEPESRIHRGMAALFEEYSDVVNGAEHLPELLVALDACLPDLVHYASTHGPGPDRRLSTLREAISRIRTAAPSLPSGG